MLSWDIFRGGVGQSDIFRVGVQSDIFKGGGGKVISIGLGCKVIFSGVGVNGQSDIFRGGGGGQSPPAPPGYDPVIIKFIFLFNVNLWLLLTTAV